MDISEKFGIRVRLGPVVGYSVHDRIMAQALEEAQERVGGEIWAQVEEQVRVRVEMMVEDRVFAGVWKPVRVLVHGSILEEVGKEKTRDVSNEKK